MLAPDSISFEDRRINAKGITPDEENDFSQHYNGMCYRLLRGSSLMKKAVDGANIGLNMLKNHERVETKPSLCAKRAGTRSLCAFSVTTSLHH